MLSPIEISTLIAFCTPWADPDIVWSLILAGSGGAPYTVRADEQVIASGEHIHSARKIIAEKFSATDTAQRKPVYYIGLTQVPVIGSAENVRYAQLLLDKCTNLAVGYERYANAWDAAKRNESSPWPRATVAFNLYRNAPAKPPSPFAAKAVALLKASGRPAPAAMTDPIYHAVAADWSASLAQRHGVRGEGPAWTLLDDSAALAQWARNGK